MALSQNARMLRNCSLGGGEGMKGITGDEVTKLIR